MPKIDTVLFFQVTDPRAADYEIVNYILAIEQLTATMLQSGHRLDGPGADALTSRDKINIPLQKVLGGLSGKWSIRVTRVEIKAIDPPQVGEGRDGEADAAEREKRAAILTAEGAGGRWSSLRGRRQAGARSCAPRAANGPRSCAPRARQLGMAEGLPVDPPTATPAPSCSPTSTCRHCRGLPRAAEQHVLGDTERGDDGPQGGDQRVRWRRQRNGDGGARGPGGNPAAGTGGDRAAAGQQRRGTAASAAGTCARGSGTPRKRHPRKQPPPHPGAGGRRRGRRHAARVAERQLRRGSLAPRRGHRAGRRQPPRPRLSIARPHRAGTRHGASTVPRQRRPCAASAAAARRLRPPVGQGPIPALWVWKSSESSTQGGRLPRRRFRADLSGERDVDGGVRNGRPGGRYPDGVPSAGEAACRRDGGLEAGKDVGLRDRRDVGLQTSRDVGLEDGPRSGSASKTSG